MLYFNKLSINNRKEFIKIKQLKMFKIDLKCKIKVFVRWNLTETRPNINIKTNFLFNSIISMEEIT